MTSGKAVLSPGVAPETSLPLKTWSEMDRSIRRDYHLHTSFTDGQDTCRAMAEAAVRRGIGEILFSEHVRCESDYFEQYAAEIDAIRHLPVKIFIGLEAKILGEDGSLDCPPALLSRCDALIGSVHSPPEPLPQTSSAWKRMSEAEAVDLEYRLALAIVEKSAAKILGHPMGMCISQRGACPLDRLYDLACACERRGKAFELNARYCSDVRAWTEIVCRAGCLVSLGSDAHLVADVGLAWSLFMTEKT